MNALHENIPTIRAPRVLIAEDDDNIRGFLGELLAAEGFDTALEARGDRALARALHDPPDLVLLDLAMPGLSGSRVLHGLREDFRTRHVPVVVLSASARADEKIRQLVAGADDFIAKPFDVDELTVRLRSVLKRAALQRDRNPLTNLPGNREIADAMTARLASRREFACLYVDLDRFKTFNDRYGFVRGDEAIARLAAVVVEAVRGTDPAGFVGHVGGDDLDALVRPSVAAETASRVIGRFDRAIRELYDAADRARGWIEVVDRSGATVRVPLVRASVGIVIAKPGRFTSPVDLARVAAEMKQAAKRSDLKWALDRRGSS